MITYVEILREKLNRLLSDEQIVAGEEMLKISREMDMITINHIIDQTQKYNKIRRDA